MVDPISDRLVGGRIKTIRAEAVVELLRYQIASLEAGSKLAHVSIDALLLDIRSPRWRQDQNEFLFEPTPHEEISDRLVGGRIKTWNGNLTFAQARYQIASLEAGSKREVFSGVEKVADIRSPRWRQDQNTRPLDPLKKLMISDRLVGGRIKTRKRRSRLRGWRYQIASLEAGSKPHAGLARCRLPDIRSPRWRQDQNDTIPFGRVGPVISDRLVGGRIKTPKAASPLLRP